MSLSVRVSAGFGVALALVAVLALVGLGWFGAVSRDIGAFSGRADLSQAAADADVSLRDLEVAVRDHLTYGDDQSLLDASWRHDTLTERLDTLSKGVVETADRQAVDKARSSLGDYWAAVQKVVTLRGERIARQTTVLEPLVGRIREALDHLKSAGGVDSAALAGDAAIAVLLMQDHLTRFIDRRDPQDAEAMRTRLADAGGKLAEMNRYLWVPGTRQAIDEVTALLSRAGDVLSAIEAAVAEEDTLRAEAMAANAAGIAANLGEIRRHAEARTQSLRGTLADGLSGYTRVALWIGGLVLMAGLVALWLVQRSVARPVRGMAAAVSALAAGRTDVALPALSGTDEIAAMARAVEALRSSTEASERQRREAEVEQSRLIREKALAEAASRTKSDFLVNMGQDLHGPLTEIVNASQSLMTELHRLGVDELATDVEHIQWTGEQLTTLVDAILDYAKVEAGAMDVCLQDFDVNRLLTEARERSMPAADLYGDSLELAAPAGLGQMHSDFTKVRQILLNLLDNACKFTQDGEITLSAETMERDGARWVRFTVTDTGRGFPTALTGRLFQPFVQGGANGAIAGRGQGKPRGAGLGLTLVGHYTAMLGGDIEVASEPSKGTRIAVALPAVYEPPAADRPLQLEPVGDAKPLLRVASLTPGGHLATRSAITQIAP
ncbi:sensor histidine kinase [Azospirillum picis]|uniref:histidine kinase n=1 Tax=Azospirillum picis TaxID=488438 RepID=A0ABU0MFJ5_9PROT|nr:HAMP domain-containing sensor histidine kinase [Azospirillum picis]MBP2298196.1 signal transduction histidine kinase [Azospirillum picis]MDQ0532034.1 signal transduction histidine kinase [Azospirillum picis]